jgi:hypothetical protein
MSLAPTVLTTPPPPGAPEHVDDVGHVLGPQLPGHCHQHRPRVLPHPGGPVSQEVADPTQGPGELSPLVLLQVEVTSECASKQAV